MWKKCGKKEACTAFHTARKKFVRKRRVFEKNLDFDMAFTEKL